MKKRTVERATCARIPTDSGEFQLCYYQSNVDDKEHLALVYGEVADKENVLVRIHSECFTGDVLGSRRCDCGTQLQRAMQLVAAEEAGVIIYLRQEGRGIGLQEKLRAYNLQDMGYDTVDANLMLGHQADGRDYTIAALMLNDLQVRSVRLLTNNPDKIEKLEALDIVVTQRAPLPADVTPENEVYLRTKVERMRHLLDLGEPPAVQADSLPIMTPMGQKQNGRPFVTLSFAQSLDGSIAIKRGQFTAISGAASMKMTHRLRAAHHALLIGIGTALADDPQMTVRLVEGRQPQPVILDSMLRLPETAVVFQHPRPPWIFTAPQASPERQQALEARGAQVFRVSPTVAGTVSLPAVLTTLAQRGVDSVMVEGGARIITSFLAGQLVDHLVVTVAPKLLGGLNAIEYVNGHGLPRLHNARYQVLGEDMVLSGEVVW